MPFNYLLTNLLVDVPAAVGAIFLDEEGEAVDWVTRHDDPYDLKVEGAYHSIFKKQIDDVAAIGNSGKVEAFMVESRDLVALTRNLPEGYYVVLVLDRNSSRALAMYHLNRAAEALARELV